MRGHAPCPEGGSSPSLSARKTLAGSVVGNQDVVKKGEQGVACLTLVWTCVAIFHPRGSSQGHKGKPVDTPGTTAITLSNQIGHVRRADKPCGGNLRTTNLVQQSYPPKKLRSGGGGSHTCSAWGGGGCEKALRCGCSPGSWRRLIDFSLLTKIHQAPVLAHRFCFCIGGGLWHQQIKDPYGNNLQCGVQALCHGGVPRCSTGAQTA